MRKIYFILFLFSGVNCFSQTWCSPGATWHYKNHITLLTSYRNGITEFKLTNTVTINSILCSKIVGTFTGVTVDPNNTPVTLNAGSFYTYANNNVYYIYDASNNIFDTLCDFNAAIGNKWRKPFGHGCFNGDLVTVIDTGHILINSCYLKKMVVNTGMSTNDTIVERIGGFNHYFTPYTICINDLQPWPDLICYEDNNFALYKKSGIINCIYDVGFEELDKENNISIFPNPFRDRIQLKSENRNLVLKHIEIFDLIGQKKYDIKEYPINKSIDLNLPSGLYLLHVEADERTKCYKIMKE